MLWTYCFTSPKLNRHKSCHVTSEIRLQKDCGFHLGYPLSITCLVTKKGQLPCYSHPAEKCKWKETDVSNLTLQEGLRLANSHTSKLESRPSPSPTLRWLMLWRTPWLYPCERPWARGAQLRLTWILDLQTLWENKLFVVLNLFVLEWFVMQQVEITNTCFICQVGIQIPSSQYGWGHWDNAGKVPAANQGEGWHSN